MNATTPSTHGREKARPWRRIAMAGLVLLFLNGMLSFSTWWPTPGIVPDARLAPEFVWLWLVLLALVAWRGHLSRTALTTVTLAYLLLVLGRYAEITVPSLFGREINLYWDGAQIPRFLWVSAQDLAWWQSAGVVAAVVLFLWAIYRLLRGAIAVAAREAAPYALRTPWVWALTGAAVVLVLANLGGVRATWPLVSKPVIPTYWRQAGLLATAFSPQRLATALPASTVVDSALAAPAGSALAALRGRDVYLIMLESYGAVVYDDARAAAALRPLRQTFAAEIAASGRHVVSAFMRSPTFAGASDLAHLGLLSGIDLSDPTRHDLLLTTERPTLISLFRRQGYQTFGLYPAVRWEWPERAFYGFDRYLESRDLGYRGPALGYWSIPDQFSLARFEQMHPRGPDAAPRFVFFPTITTHLPFNPVPPYQPDWARVLTAQPFDAADVQRALGEAVNWLDMFPDYVRMIDYNYRWLGGLMRLDEPRDTIYVLVGDHQPAANITGEGASWDVPVHIVSRDVELLARFGAMGFHAGVEPPRAPLGALHDLTAILLGAFAADGAKFAAGGSGLVTQAVGLR
jgi:hypothetical protein